MPIDETALRRALKRINAGRSVRGVVLFATAMEVVRSYLKEVNKDERLQSMVPLEFSKLRIHDHCAGNGCPECDGNGYIIGKPRQVIPEDEMPKW